MLHFECGISPQNKVRFLIFFEHFNFFAEKHHSRAFLLGEETKNVLYQIE